MQIARGFHGIAVSGKRIKAKGDTAARARRGKDIMKSIFNNEVAWVWHPDYEAGTPGFTLFRRAFYLEKPETINLAVSADNRYNLFLDERPIGRGPCRSDLTHYRYETYTLSLPAGRHVLAAEVLVYRVGFQQEEGPWSEIRAGGGFLVAGETASESLSTPSRWRCVADLSRSHRKWRDAWDRRATVPAPPMEAVDFSRAAIDWKSVTFDDASWLSPKEVDAPCLKATCDSDPQTRWWLMERTIPQMETRHTPIAAITRDTARHARLTDGKLSADIPAGKNVILLDLGQNQTSLVHFAGKGGAGTCRVAYAERLRQPVSERPDERDMKQEIGGDGMADLLSFSRDEWRFDSFWYRSGRFIELEFDLSEPLRVNELSVEFIAYPFELKANIEKAADATLRKIYDVAWHTARCCAHEHYEDCPYWEQLQYVGDTRIQALISYAATGDGRLGKQAIEQFDNSRLPSGITCSRYPSNRTQIIPGFSLFWVLMIEDYYQYFADPAIISEHLNGIRATLNWFEEKRSDQTHLIGNVGYWNFTDWVKEWPLGKSDRKTGKPETIINLIYAECCRATAAMCDALNLDQEKERFLDRQRRSLDAVNQYCFSRELNLYRDTPDEEWYSQHVNAWAILAGAADATRTEALLDAIMNNAELSRCTLYFSFYLLETARRVKNDSAFERLLDQWRNMLDSGFTTFPEIPSLNTRSDCHAWSSAPVYEIIRQYFGVSPEEPGFDVIRVAPRPGSLSHFAGTVPVGKDRYLRVEWENKTADFTLTLQANARLNAQVTLPTDNKTFHVELSPHERRVFTRAFDQTSLRKN